MVSGRYLPDGAHGETSSYTRADYDNTDPSKRSFLVRLRRTLSTDPTVSTVCHPPGAGPIDNECDISSSGPRVPLLFGRGTFIQQIQDGSSPRLSGLPVRATSITDAKPALRIVGSARPDLGLPGVTNPTFALTQEFWSSLLVSGRDVTIAPDTNGTICATICVAGVTPCLPPVTCPGADNAVAFVKPAPEVGSTLLAASPVSPPLGPAYVAIHGGLMSPPSTQNRVIGFGLVIVTAVDALLPVTFHVSPYLDYVSNVNASSVVPGGFLSGLSLADRDEIMSANQTLRGVRVATLVR